jgi:hypothetical protein
MFSRTGLPAGDGDAATSFLPATFSPRRAAESPAHGPDGGVLGCGDDRSTRS